MPRETYMIRQIRAKSCFTVYGMKSRRTLNLLCASFVDGRFVDDRFVDDMFLWRGFCGVKFGG
jgi:hypothetical protein